MNKPLSVRAAAEHLKVTPGQIRNLVSAGRLLKAEQVDKRTYFITEASVLAYQEGQGKAHNRWHKNGGKP